MRLHTRALLAILLILLPSGSDTAPLYYGGLNGPEVEDVWNQFSTLHPRRPDQFDDFDTFADAIGSPASNGLAVATPFPQQQPEAHLAFPPPTSAPIPAPGPQAQAISHRVRPQQVSDPYRRQHYGENGAREGRRAQQAVPGPQEGIRSIMPQRITAARWYNLEATRKLANVEVIPVDDADRQMLFTEKAPRGLRDIVFKLGRPELQAWILKHFQQQSRTDERSFRWVNSPQSIDTFLGDGPNASTVHRRLIRAVRKGTRFRDYLNRPFARPFIVGDHLIYFQQQGRSDFFRVFAIPLDMNDPKLVSRNYMVDLLGTLELPPVGPSPASQSRASSRRSRDSQRRPKPRPRGTAVPRAARR